jgi:porin
MVVDMTFFFSSKNILRSSVVSITWFFLLSCFMVAIATAEVARAGPDVGERGGLSYDSLDDPDEPSNLLRRIEERNTEKDSLLPVSPLGRLHDSTAQGKQDLYDATGLKLGFSITHLFQWLSEALPGEDTWGTATTTDLVGNWDLIDKGEATLGQAVFHVQGRWDYGTTGPEDLGTFSLGSLLGTANTFASYTPAFLLRNLYWRQGSPQAGWAYRLGKITPDATLGTSAHIAAPTTFLPTASTGPFSIALPDSGLGAVGAWYINDRATLVGLVSDANGDRYDFGDISAGDFFKAAEFHFKVAPRTPKAGYSKFTLWHTDGTEDGLPANGSNGPSGWGIFGKYEQEMTDDGRAIVILRYGKSFEDSAFYREQASAHFLLYDPPLLHRLQNDLIGVAFNWVDATNGVRDEYDVEGFYRFPLFPHVDMTLSYQLVIDPALDLGIDRASVFSLRLRTSF